MRPYLLFLLACVCALTGAIAARGGTGTTPEPAPTTTASTTATTSTESDAAAPDVVARQLQRIIDTYRQKVWHWQHVMGNRVTRKLPNPPPDLRARVHVWQSVATRTWVRAKHPPHAAAWRCLQRYEGAWTDSGGPYYGGLQMDLTFQRHYGGYLLRKKGTANHWTPLEQMWVAERALRAGRGFYPWPNTGRMCGLL
jgi:hypothetical protein